MSALLGSIVGLGSAIGTGIIDVVSKKQEQKAKIAEMQAKALLVKSQAEADIAKMKAQGEIKMEEVNTTADIDEAKQLYDHDKSFAGVVGWMQTVRASVRPFVTYIFFLMFLLFKICLVWDAIRYSMNLVNVAHIIFDTETQTLFSAVIAFWFGSRTISKFRNRI